MLPENQQPTSSSAHATPPDISAPTVNFSMPGMP